MFEWFFKKRTNDYRYHGILNYLKTSKKIVALTGAGISTASGIPDFRSPVSGIWDRFDPNIFTSYFFNQHPEQFYEAGQKLVPGLLTKHPTLAHHLLAEMEARGMLSCVVTQNIDGLHQKAGNRTVFELHGNVQRAFCVDCHTQSTTEDVFAHLREGINPPRCRQCQGIMKIDVVLFGDPMPDDFAKALTYVNDADFFFILGTSLSVQPANLIPRRAFERYARLVIVNRETTEYDRFADFVIHDDLESFAQKLADYLEINLPSSS